MNTCIKKYLLILLLLNSCYSINTASSVEGTSSQFNYLAKKLDAPPNIDGVVDITVWQELPWYPIDHLILGSEPSQDDFSGRFKVAWHAQQLYVLVEIVDDALVDTHADPFDNYWNDDTLEVFLDSDGSGGIHHTNHTAFAYHIALDNQFIDIGVDGRPISLSHHGQSNWKRSQEKPHVVIWEIKIDVYGNDYIEGTKNNLIELKSGQLLGFSIAYCDADGSTGREHFINSVDVPAVNGDRNRAYIDADTFGKLLLAE